MGNEYRTYRSEPRFLAHLSEIADIRTFDDAMVAIEWALCTNPEAFPVIPGTRIRTFSTRRVLRADGILQPLFVWFTIEEDGTVVLLDIEIDREDEA